MKSSTIRRSNLSRESMEVIEALAKENENEGTLGEYVRPDEVVAQSKDNDFTSKAQEIDLLWQNFKTTQFNSNSPMAHILMGFISGVVVTLLVIFGISSYTAKNNGSFTLFGQHKVQHEQTLEQQADSAQNTVENSVTPIEDGTVTEDSQEQSDTTSTTEQVTSIDSSKMKKYVVKDGDTGESIIKHFYGSYTPERAEAIIKVNNLKNLDRINIDQELLIPVEQ